MMPSCITLANNVISYSISYFDIISYSISLYAKSLISFHTICQCFTSYSIPMFPNPKYYCMLYMNLHHHFIFHISVSTVFHLVFTSFMVIPKVHRVNQTCDTSLSLLRHNPLWQGYMSAVRACSRTYSSLSANLVGSGQFQVFVVSPTLKTQTLVPHPKNAKTFLAAKGVAVRDIELFSTSFCTEIRCGSF